MIKKLIIIFLLFFSFLGISFAWPWPLEEEYRSLQKELKINEWFLNDAKTLKKNAESNLKYLWDRASAWAQNQTESDIQAIKFYEEQLKAANDDIGVFQSVVELNMPEYNKAKKAYIESDESNDDFSTTWFKLNVSDVFPESKYTGETNMNRRANAFFADIIQKLMIWLGSVALLLMTIWAWFMILYHWEDSMLTKWKSIFSAGIISLVIALLSFYMVELVKYLIA